MHTETATIFPCLRMAVLLTLVISLLGCGGEPDIRTERVTIAGRISVPAELEPTAPVYVTLYHEWALEGELRHPLEFIDSFAARAGDYEYAFDYPVDLGEGLLVYAWIDADEDGTLCTPAVRIDRAGLTQVPGFEPGNVEADIELTAPCAGPDWFYPSVD